MNMIDIIGFLMDEGDQTVQRQIGYIRRETKHFRNDQPKILQWLINEGMLPSLDAVKLYNKVTQEIGKTADIADKDDLCNCQTILQVYTDKNGLPLRKTTSA